MCRELLWAGGNSGFGADLAILHLQDAVKDVQRAGTKAGNKGAEAALSALEMINVLKNLGV